ncbi:Endoplasmic reticulum-Golgi intermediate compartment protein 3 [Tritrichomonas musculus]|uniref:Endoplasmic reticulum-Golgi intermediate compartment protein 3 n=1 Tax=Tritrichomonas musculus TaxID=1915356 RepID=A0ABR2HUT6_9EUKA
MDFIRLLDFYPKFRDDFAQKTTTGGILAITSFVSMTALFACLYRNYLQPPINQYFFVPSPSLPFKTGRKIDPDNLPKMSINFDIFLYHLPCSFLQVNSIDIIKESDDSIEGRLKMERFDSNRNKIAEKHFPKENKNDNPKDYCGSCYGIKEGCCNTCYDVRKAFKKKNKPPPPIASIEQCTKDGYLEKLKEMKDESCRVYGSLQVHQHPGSIHFGIGDESQMNEIYEKIGINITEINISHKITSFHIGNQSHANGFYPLDNSNQIQGKNGRAKFYYFLRIVPIGLNSNSFSFGVSQYQHYRKNTSNKFPGVFFNYDISPISVYKDSKKSLINFLVEVSAILGGVFAIASFADSLIFRCSSDEDSKAFTKGEQYELLSKQ